MLDGQAALRQIDRVIDEARGEAETLKSSVAELNDREIELRRNARAALAELARFRLDQARAETVSGATAGIDADVAALLRERAADLDRLNAEISALGQTIASLESERTSAAAKTLKAAEELDEAELALQQSLEHDPAHREQLQRTEEARKVAGEAEHKHSLAEADREEKGAPYRGDPLFMYLWERGYGTPAYRRSGLIRMADRWVSRLIRFEDARRNYYMLNEIPTRLGEHVARMNEKAEAEIDALAALERAARDNTEVPALEKRLKDAEASVADIDQSIASARDDARAKEAERNTYESGQDEKFKAAVNRMIDDLDDESIAELRRSARATRMPEDDEIVERLVDIEDDIDDLVARRDELARHARAKADRLIELEDMRVEFRRRRYDDYGSSFTDGGLFQMILAEFIRGAITGGAYWDRLDRAHRRTTIRSKPDFGSGRFRFPGPLSFPGSSRSSSGSRSRSRSRGGFRTGGGFGGRRGGGGFRTGGGF